MKHESLWRISVVTTTEAEDAISELTTAVLGQPAVAYFDNESGLSTVTVYLRRGSHAPGKARAEISTGLERIKNCGLETVPGKIVISRLRQENWAESWKRHFKPIEIGNVLLIKPSWSKRKPRGSQAVVVLDPGLSFGTGQHPTTAFCLREIAGRQKNGDGSASRPRPKPPSFLDLGAGSGILSIAAAKLGYSPVNAIDFDREAVRIARANARANRVHQKLTILYGNVAKLPVCPRRPRQGYDLVCANLISDLLIAERRRIAATLKHSGTLVLAGILKSEFGRVQKAFEGLELRLISSRSEREWRSGSFQFRPEIL